MKCDGTGFLAISACCGAYPTESHGVSSLDLKICPKCGERDEFNTVCDLCNGEGFITEEQFKSERSYERADEYYDNLEMDNEKGTEETESGNL